MICSAGGGIRVLHVGNKSFFSESVARCCHHVARFGAQSAINRLSEHAGLISIYAIWAVSYEQYPPAVPDIEYIELACESGGNRMPSAACFGPLSVSRSVTVCVRPQEYAGTDGRRAGTGPPQVRGGASAWPQSRGPPSPSRPCPRAAAPRSGTPPHPFPVVFRPERTHPKHHQRIATALRLRVCRGPAVPSRFLRIQARQAQKTRAMCRIGGQPGAETTRRSRPARPRRPLGARAGTRPRRTEQSIILQKLCYNNDN